MKRITSLCLVLALVVVAAFSVGIGASGVSKYGDVNGDNSVDMKDVLAIRMYISTHESPVNFLLQFADCQTDGSVDMKDVLLIRKYIAGQNVQLGPDEVSDSSKTEPTSMSNLTDPTATTTTIVPPNSDVSDTGVSTTAERTSKSRIPTSSTHHDPVDFSSQPKVNVITSPEVTLGTWWWRIGDGVAVQTRETILDFLKYNGVTEIYYYCYDRMRTPNTRQETHEFVVSAMSRGMRVAVLYDDPNSQEADNTYFTDTVVANYLLYKQEYPSDAVYGIHADVEHKITVANAQKYVDNFLLAEVQPARDKGIIVELDLKPSYTESHKVKINGTSYNFYEAVGMYCDTLCIMSYRTKVANLLHCVELSGPYAKKTHTKVVYSIEMGDSGEGSGVDFSKSSKTVAYGVLNEFASKLKASDYPDGLGFAIHSTRDWYDLKVS